MRCAVASWRTSKQTLDAEALSKDQARQARVDALVDGLVQRYRRGELVRPPADADDWTSRPLTLSLLGIESRGRVPFREGENDFLLLRLGQVLEEEARVRLVERNVLDKLLEELKLSSSALVDRNTALKVGRLLAARLISVGTVVGVDNEWQLTVRVVETETSTVVASVAQSRPVSQTTATSAEAVGKDLAVKLRRAFPLRARVLAVDAAGVTLNIGTAEGLAVGQKLQVFREGKQGQRGVVGEVEVVEVQENPVPSSSGPCTPPPSSSSLVAG